jgi:hypothetical protein
MSQSQDSQQGTFYGSYGQTVSFPQQYYAHPVVAEHPVQSTPVIVGSSSKSEDVLRLEEQVRDLQKRLRRSLEFMQETQVLKPRQIVLLEPETEEATVRKHPTNDVFLGGQYYPTKEALEIVKIPKTEVYEESMFEPRLLSTGVWANVEVKIQKTRPIFKRTPIPIAKLPRGSDVTEYVSEIGTPLSPELLAALRRAAEQGPEPIRNAFSKAVAAEWGPVITPAQAPISPPRFFALNAFSSPASPRFFAPNVFSSPASPRITALNAFSSPASPRITALNAFSAPSSPRITALNAFSAPP